MKFLWAVSKGSYSDYRVICVADSKKRAKKIAATLNVSENHYGQAEVEALPYFDRTPEEVDVHCLQCEVWDDGTATEPRESVRHENEADMLYPQHYRPVTWRWVRAPMHNGRGGRLEVHGTDLQRVQQVFSDTRAQLLVEDALRARREVNS